MAYQKLMDGSFMVCGYVPKDAEMKLVGQNNSSKTTFSVKASEVVRPDGSKEAHWTNCVAWHDNARACASLKKGDYVLCVGRMESNEYNGKTYKNLVVEFAIKSGVPASVPASTVQTIAESSGASDSNGIGDLGDFEEILNDSDLPF